jgi:hypothetical protein
MAVQSIFACEDERSIQWTEQGESVGRRTRVLLIGSLVFWAASTPVRVATGRKVCRDRIAGRLARAHHRIRTRRKVGRAT